MTVDGMKTTDMASISSPSYYDFDMFEELNVSTRTLDVSTGTPASS